jgi:hypothetical protein
VRPCRIWATALPKGMPARMGLSGEWRVGLSFELSCRVVLRNSKVVPHHANQNKLIGSRNPPTIARCRRLTPETYQLLSPRRNWNISPGNKYIIAMLLAMGSNQKHN